MSNSPSTNGGNGRDGAGRFAPGWKGGTGNPHARRVGELRAALIAAVSDADWQAIVHKLIEDAKAGDKAARAELFDRTLGRAKQPVDLSMTAGGDENLSVDELRAAILADIAKVAES